jgi:hypothetical protein
MKIYIFFFTDLNLYNLLVSFVFKLYEIKRTAHDFQTKLKINMTNYHNKPKKRKRKLLTCILKYIHSLCNNAEQTERQPAGVKMLIMIAQPVRTDLTKNMTEMKKSMKLVLLCFLAWALFDSLFS